MSLHKYAKSCHETCLCNQTEVPGRSLTPGLFMLVSKIVKIFCVKKTQTDANPISFVSNGK